MKDEILPQLEALKFLNNWSSSLLFIQSAIFITIFVYIVSMSKNTGSNNTPKSIFLAAMFAAMSMLIGFNVIGTIPWSTQNLYVFSVKYNDIYQFPNYIGIKLWMIAFGQHINFSLCLLCILYFLWTKTKK